MWSFKEVFGVSQLDFFRGRERFGILNDFEDAGGEFNGSIFGGEIAKRGTAVAVGFDGGEMKEAGATGDGPLSDDFFAAHIDDLVAALVEGKARNVS